ncbi:MAG: PIN domain-containing protein [Bryobacteraceae bacterium]
MRIYLDACCLSRLTDDQSHPRIREEAEAIDGILGLVCEGRADWVSSAVLAIEIGRNPDPDRRRDAAEVHSHAGASVTPDRQDAARAEFLQTLGFGAFDALHLACAERGGSPSPPHDGRWPPAPRQAARR